MAITAKKKSVLNLATSLLGQVITIVLGIVIPRMFILSFGSDVNGFISSISQIFVYVALLEAGVGTASQQAMYAPLGNNDRDSINSILAATHHFYMRTGFLYLAAITGIAFLYPLFVESSLSYWVMVSIVMLTGVGGAFPYFLHAKYSLLLNGDGKSYVLNLINQGRTVLLSLLKIVLLSMGANVILVESLYLLVALLQSLAIILYIKKKYGWINLKTEPNFQAISQKNSVLVHQFSSLIFNNTDILILTFFCDLNQVSIYTLYKYLFGFAITVINLLSSSVNFRLGQLFSKREHFLKLYDMYEVFHIALTFSLLTLVYLYITPFLRLYTAGMDIEYIVPFLPLTFCVMEYLNSIRTPTNNVIVYAGKFKETQWRSLTEALINLTVSLVAVHFLGINGVVLGTVAALLYRSNDVILFANRRVLGRSAWHTYRTILVNVILSVATVLVYTWIDMEFTGYVTFVVSGFVSVLICVPLYLAVSYLLYPSVGKSFVVYVGDILKKRRKKR